MKKTLVMVAVLSILCAFGYGAFLNVAGDGSVYLAGLAVTAFALGWRFSWLSRRLIRGTPL